MKSERVEEARGRLGLVLPIFFFSDTFFCFLSGMTLGVQTSLEADTRRPHTPLT